MKLTEKTIQQEYKYRGKIINLRVDKIELENGRPSTRLIDRPSVGQ